MKPTTKTSNLRRRHGITQAPIPATRAYSRPMEFDGAIAKSWLFHNEKDGTLTQANSYDKSDGEGDCLGRNYDATHYQVQITDPKDLTKRLKGYTEVPASPLFVKPN